MPSHSTRRRSTALSATPPQDARNAEARHALRQSVAALAAQFIAEGLDDFHAAKLKAAKKLGLRGNEHDALPDNHEIETALREYQTLFATDNQPVVLAALRDVAIEAMLWLRDFSPWLVGGVLNGTANEFSAIELEIVGFDAKSFEIFLLNQNVAFDLHTHHAVGHARRRRRELGANPAAATICSYDIEFDDAPLSITLYDSHSQRQARNPASSIKHDRAQCDEVARRFVEAAAR